MSNEPSDRAERWRTWSAWGSSAVHGLFGDHLADHFGSLSLDMALYHQGRRLALTPAALRAAHPHFSSKVCVLVHGLGCTERIWTFADPRRAGLETSYGALLHEDLAYTPLFVRYNTGLSVAENGRALALLLAELLAAYPAPVDELTLVGHSMGGLVIRSACHADAAADAVWTPRVRHAFYIGTPHDGANLERLVHVAATVLHAVPNPITRLIGGIFDLRSQGVKDLRDGTLLAPDVFDEARARGATSSHHRRAVPWLAGARHYLIGGSITGDPDHVAAVLLGDGLVAMPRAAAGAAGRGRPIPAEHIRVFPRLHHLRLTRDLTVYEQIRDWCAQD